MRLLYYCLCACLISSSIKGQARTNRLFVLPESSHFYQPAEIIDTNGFHVYKRTKSYNIGEWGGSSILLYGDHLIKNNKPFSFVINNKQKTRVSFANHLFVSYHSELRQTRITNYAGNIVIDDSHKTFTLKKGETIIIYDNLSVRKYHNENASSDSLWMTNGSFDLDDLEIDVILGRLAHAFNYNILFNYSQPVSDFQGGITCNNYIYDELALFISICASETRFCYNIVGHSIEINKEDHNNK
ncbi:hypothetical protein [Niastella sp. OAS944]|uniref:hypothetical protein n=1 Tax=Niastella sp. OAS944 TaxID=2664089 RepID=UPI00348A14F0|nr:hypothetical protein [Chitinophagaceae bacterium OAS944]